MTSRFFYTTGHGTTEVCIYWWKFEPPVCDMEQQYNHGNRSGCAPFEQVYRGYWVLSCGVCTTGNLRIWQKLLHVYLHWGQSLDSPWTEEKRCAIPLRPLALRAPRVLMKFSPCSSEMQQNYNKLLWFIITFALLPDLDISMGYLVKMLQWSSPKYTDTKKLQPKTTPPPPTPPNPTNKQNKLVFGFFCCLSFYVYFFFFEIFIVIHKDIIFFCFKNIQIKAEAKWE